MRKLKILYCSLFAVVVTCNESTAPVSRIPRWASLGFGDAVIWVAEDTGASGFHTPLLVQDIVVYLAHDGSFAVRAVDANTGASLWSAVSGFAGFFAASTSSIGALGYSLEVFTMAGVKARTFSIPNGFSSRLAADGSRFIAGSSINGTVSMIDASSGALVWSRTLGGNNTRTRARGVSVAGEQVFASLLYDRNPGVSVDSAIIAAMDRNTGALNWRVAIDTLFPFTSPIPDADKVYVATIDGRVVALSQATGAIVWTAKANVPFPIGNLGALSVCDGRIISQLGDGKVVALSPVNGSVIWSSSASGTFSVDCSYGTVLAQSGLLTVLDAATGISRGTYPKFVGEGELSVLGVSRDATAIYVLTNRGMVKMKAP